MAGSNDQAYRIRPRLLRVLGIVALLATQWLLAELSLAQENPTVDEVAHLPAGVTYWQKGTYRLYPHNPPLVKLIAALPVVWAGPETAMLYGLGSWTSSSPSHPTFSQSFAKLNIDRYFEFFEAARSFMPFFLVLGGIVVYLWSSRLYGTWGGFLSLALWCFCPNLLAHGRLVTTDVGSTVMGVFATYLFWRYLQKPGWKWATAAGIALGLAQLSKFSMLVLLAIWPAVWLVRLLLTAPRATWLKTTAVAVPHAVLILALMVLVINTGYQFEKVGKRLGEFEFACASLTRPIVPGTMNRPRSENTLLLVAWQNRINRFRGTFLANLPVPLPQYYVQGFDEQKLEAEGIPKRFFRSIEENKAQAANEDDEVAGYSVYLNGEMRDSGWWYYYIATFLYKVPEGTILLLALSLVPLVLVKRSSELWADEITLAAFPAVILFTMSFLTDINLGLRYVLAIFPYIYVGVGRLAPWIASLDRLGRQVLTGLVGLSLLGTGVATASIHPHYLAYLNWASGGPDRVPARLIDSNLDWGQDLVGLQRWAAKNIPNTPIGLAYFGQINPNIFSVRDEPFPWFLPPVEPAPKAIEFMYDESERPKMIGFAPTLKPGYYAVSASILYGLPWRHYDSSPAGWGPAWRILGMDSGRQYSAFGYFRNFTPIARIGHSIYVYKLTQEDIDRAGPAWAKAVSTPPKP